MAAGSIGTQSEMAMEEYISREEDTKPIDFFTNFNMERYQNLTIKGKKLITFVETDFVSTPLISNLSIKELILFVAEVHLP